MKNYKCFDCGSIFKDDELKSHLLLCPSCGGHLEEGSFQKGKKPEDSEKAYEYQKEESTHQKKPEDSRPEQDCFMFSCLSCGKSLRVAFPFTSLSFRCTNCSGTYEIHYVDNIRPIYLVVPKWSHKKATPKPRQPTMPVEVRKALRLFELNEGVSWEDVKAKYRKCMCEYHPDKVAYLGADLRKLADEKTKAYNAAYAIIQRYFEEVEQHHKA
jgi:DnaJ-domain-containing protein 1